MKWITACYLLFWFLISGCTESRIRKDQLPNIVFILADDLGVPQLSCYGSTYYQTPHIDHLAEMGIRFTNAYSAGPVCSPTRAAFMTGKYPARLHLTDYIPGNDSQDRLLITPSWTKFLPLEELTIGEVLKKQGYATALFGKWHLSREKFPPASLDNGPLKQGFDEVFISYKPGMEHYNGWWQTPEGDAHNVDTITSRAIDFMERNRGHPFFVILSHNSIHAPIMEKKVTIEKYQSLPGSSRSNNSPVLGAMVEHLDASVGRVIGYLEESGLIGSTMVVFYSDNGGLEADASQEPFKHGKGWLYEGGIRVPLIVRWEGQIGAGRLSNALVNSTDFLPSLSEIASVNADSLGSIDGKSFCTVLFNMKELATDAHRIYWNYPHYHNGPPSAAVRDKRYKLIEWYEGTIGHSGKSYELFDLLSDPGETIDLSDSLSEVTKELAEALQSWRIEMGAQVPVLRK